MDTILKTAGESEGPHKISVVTSYGFLPMTGALSDIQAETTKRYGKQLFQVTGHFDAILGGNVAMPPFSEAAILIAHGAPIEMPARRIMDQVDYLLNLFAKRPADGGLSERDRFGKMQSGQLFYENISGYELTHPYAHSDDAVAARLRVQ